MESFYKDQFRGTLHQGTSRPPKRSEQVSAGAVLETDQFKLTPHGKSIIFSAPVMVTPPRAKRRWLVLLACCLSAAFTFIGTMLLLVLDPASLATVYNVMAALVEALSINNG